MLTMLLARAAEAASTEFVGNDLPQLGLSMIECRALLALSEAAVPMRLAALQAACGVEMSTLSRAVSKLQRGKLASKRRERKDIRAVTIQITDAGTTKAAQARGMLEGREKGIFKGVSHAAQLPRALADIVKRANGAP